MKSEEFFLHRAGRFWENKNRKIVCSWNDEEKQFENCETGEIYTAFLRYDEDTVLIIIV